MLIEGESPLQGRDIRSRLSNDQRIMMLST